MKLAGTTFIVARGNPRPPAVKDSPVTTPVIEDCIGDLFEISHPPVFKTKAVQYNLEEGEFYHHPQFLSLSNKSNEFTLYF